MRVTTTVFLQAAKSKVQKTFDGTITPHFRHFFVSPLFDRLAKACIHHFLASFERDLLIKVCSIVRKLHSQLWFV